MNEGCIRVDHLEAMASNWAKEGACHGQSHLLPGPSPEWMVRHSLTPGDLRDLQVEPVKSSVAVEDYSILMNISWILRADGKFISIKLKCLLKQKCAD